MRPLTVGGFFSSLACLMAIAVTMAPAASMAEEAIPTAAGAPTGGAPIASPGDTLRLDNYVDQGPGFLGPVGPCGGPARTPDGKPNRSPHGSVWAGVGTSGYRDIGGAACVPLGDSGAVSVAVDAGQINGWSNRH